MYRTATPGITSSLATLAVTLFLSGCGVGSLTGTAASPVTLASGGLSGIAHGGQQPIASAVVRLMVPGQTGYGSAPSVLATTTSDANGGFTLPAYTCPAGANLVYITANGGNSGSGVNPLIGEAAVLGPCSSLSPSTFINVTEVTTVAAAYVLAPFAAVTPAGTGIGTSAGNAAGLANAFATASNLAPYATGTARGPGDLPGMILPTAYLNTLANIIAACVNSAGSLTGTCGTLLTNTSVNSVPPVDTFQAALNIAMHPGSNITALYNLSTPVLVYAPALATAPADFTIAIGYNGGALTLGDGALSVAIDAAGNAWISTGHGSATVHALTEISPAGAYYSGAAVSASSGFGTTSLTSPVGLAIDPSGFVLVANNNPAQVVKFNPSGTVNATYTATSLNFPNGIAVDANSNSWVANFGGNKATEILAAGTEAGTGPYTLGTTGSVDMAAGPLAMWTTSYGSGHTVSRIDLTTFAVTNVFVGGSTAGVALDHANNAWVAVTGNGNVFEISNSGTVLNPAGGFIVADAGAQNIAVDGLGNVFTGVNISDTAPGGLVEFSNSGALLSSGTTGYAGSKLIPNLPQAPHGIAIDGSGNVWLAGTNLSSINPTYVAEVIGVAAPVVTPLSLAAKNNTLGVRP